MKLKEINRTAIQSWSPAQHHPIYLATGTSAQQLDASFSTNASLEFFELDLTDQSLGMKSCGSLASSHRYHKLVWGPYGMESGAHPSGVLVAGGENGNVILYDPAKIMAGGTDVIIAESSKHNGPVRALDINPFQTNLFASGGNESEIYIWDMNNFSSPMTPGPKSQPLEDISCIAWNRQVQHILASASPGGRASVWDLRKNDLIIKVSDHSNRMHCSGLAWNPEVATQLVLSSEDDRMPVIQMWDLRFATSPLKILENHTLGILSIAWSLADPELLLSCGKDSRILCWNPNTGEILYELPTSSQWCFDIQWCPRNPAVLSAAGFDGHIDIYSIMGGSSQAQSQRHADQISTSFGNMDPFGTGQTLPPLQLPQSVAPAATVTPLKKPPKWIRRPVGASFGFGGKLVSLENSKPNPQQPQQPTARVVHVSQVVTETDFLKRSNQLQATLSAGSFVDFCQAKIQSCENEFEKTVWSFLKANFESDIRSRYLELLGYNKEELALKISAALEEKPADPPQITAAPVEIPAEPPQILSAPEEIPAEPPQTLAAPEEIPAESELISAETEEIPVEPPQVDLLPPASLQPVPDLSFLPPLDTPEAAFDMIAAANLMPAATLELDSTPDPEPEEPAAVEEPVVTEELEELEAVDLEDVPIIEAEEMVDEILLDEKEDEEEEEDFFLDEGEGAPVEEVPTPAEITAPVEEPTEAPAPPADPGPAPTADLAPAPVLIDEPAEVQAPVLIEEPFEIAEPVSAPSPIPAPAPAPTPAQEGAVSLSVSQDIDGLITQALLTGDFEGAVELCLHDNRMADSIILAIAGGPELLEKTQKKYFINTHSKITKLISAVVMKDWHDVLTTCELQNWREALAAVMTYAKPEEFSSLCDLLGSRLEGADDAHLQAQACLCYICAGNVEKLVSCWTRAQNGHSPLSLQDLVEKVVVLRRAVELTQQNGAAAIGILMAEKMSQYASLLASQGSLSTAITYLPDNTNQVSVQQLRDRLRRALGQAAAPAAVAPVQPQRVQPQQPAPTPVQPGLQQPPFMPTMVPQPSAAAPVPAPTPAASAPVQQQQYYQPVRAASTVTSWSNQTPTALPNVPPPPLQAEQQQVEPPNPMYGMPPSGSAAAPPPSSTPAYMYSHQYQRYPQVSQYPSGAGGAPIYHPLQYSSSSSAPPPPEPPGFLSQYTQQPSVPSHGAPRVYPGQPYSSQCLSSSPPSHPPFFPNAVPSSSSSSSSSSFPAPAPCGATLQHGGPGSPVSYMPPPPPTASGVSGTQPDPELVPASRRTGPQNGWNDPPALSRAPKKKQVPMNFTPPAPITAPIMSPLGADPQAQPAPPSGPPQAMMQGPPQGAQVPYSGLQQQPLAPPPMNPAVPKTSLEGAPGAPTGDFIQPLQSIPAEKIQKKPIPDEHLVLKTTFEGLIQKCLAVATDPQTKRKLDDATKRLEALYDKLREQTLSPPIVAGLHNMARSIESRSYAEGLNIHTHIVSSSNFSETSAFMPVLKVVLTQANKLGV